LQKLGAEIAGNRLRMGVTESSAEVAADDDTPLVVWEVLYIFDEAIEAALAHQVEFNIRSIKSRNAQAAFRHIPTDGRKGALAGEIPHHRHDQVARFERLQKLEVTFV